MWLITGIFKYSDDLANIGQGKWKALIFAPNHPDATYSVLGTGGYRITRWGYAFAAFLSLIFWVAILGGGWFIYDTYFAV
jgi:hypothetical protein